MEKISVIVPVYNRLEHLRSLIICLIKQEAQPYELIISDDGSSQDVMDFIKDLIPKIKFKVKYVRQSDLGFRKTRALNNGVKHSEGEILVFCDQDLIFPPDYLKVIKENINKKIFLMSRPISVTQEEKNKILEDLNFGKNYSELLKYLPKQYSDIERWILRKDFFRRILNKLKLNKRGIRLVGMSYALYKENYIAVNGYDEKYRGWGLEDDDFGNRLYVYGIRGKEMKTSLIQMHLYHPFDPTKKQSANEEYYYIRKKEIFNKKDYFCKYGYNNSYDEDEILKKQLCGE